MIRHSSNRHLHCRVPEDSIPLAGSYQKSIRRPRGHSSGREEKKTRNEKMEVTSREAQGVIRLYAPDMKSSRLLAVNNTTTCSDICTRFNCDSIFLRIGGLHTKALAKSECPLSVMQQVLLTIGYASRDECLAVGAQPFLRHIFAFFLGRPEKQLNDESCEILRSSAWLRKGRIIRRWSRAHCLLYNNTLRLCKDGEEDEIVLLEGAVVERQRTRRGEAVKIDTHESTFLLLLDDSAALHSWIAACQKERSEVLAGHCDLSDRSLLLVPDDLFSSRVRSLLTHLNLRRNSLLIRANSLGITSAPLLGWVEDISRLSQLQSLDLSANRLGSFPPPLAQLSSLTRLSLAGNQLSVLPVHIRLLVNLEWLDVSNNWLSDLPSQLSDCSSLAHLNLSFNRFQKIPLVLGALREVREWLLAGNEIRVIEVPPQMFQRLLKLDLRRNRIALPFRLPTLSADCLREIDLRDNCRLGSIQLTNLSSLRILRADRLRLTDLHLNGSSLQQIHASHNLLDCLVAMPAPRALQVLSLSSNRLTALPDWLADLDGLHTLDVSCNQLHSLPPRLLRSSSLRRVFVGRNCLSNLPESVTAPLLESLDLHSNLLDSLPSQLFHGSPKLRELNVSGNSLEWLPSPPPGHRVRCLRAAFNNLFESVAPLVCSLHSLVTLDLSHNRLHFFDDSSLRELRVLEELNLSGNVLNCLPHALSALPSLRVLRAHSNSIHSLPNLSASKSLQIVDVCNNRLERVSSTRCAAPSLRMLDLSCNPQLQLQKRVLREAAVDVPSPLISEMLDVTSKTFMDILISRSMSFVNVEERGIHAVSGFSETAGNRNKQCIRQLRFLSGKSNLVGIVDGGSNDEIAEQIVSIVKKCPLSSGAEGLSALLLHIHVSLAAAGERIGASVLLCAVEGEAVHVAGTGSVRAALFCSHTLSSSSASSPSLSSPSSLIHLLPETQIDDVEYERIREASSILDEENRIDGVSRLSRQLGLFFLLPAVVPSPIKVSRLLPRHSRLLLIANQKVWSTVPEEELCRILENATNARIAAKTIQDAAESFGACGNLSIIVVSLGRSDTATSSSSSSAAPISSRSEPIPRPSSLQLQHIEERLDRISQVWLFSLFRHHFTSVIARIEVEHKEDEQQPTLAPPRPLYLPPPPPRPLLPPLPPPPPLPLSSPPSLSSACTLQIIPSRQRRSPRRDLPPSETVSSCRSSPAPPPPDPSRARFESALHGVRDALKLKNFSDLTESTLI